MNIKDFERQLEDWNHYLDQQNIKAKWVVNFNRLPNNHIDDVLEMLDVNKHNIKVEEKEEPNIDDVLDILNEINNKKI